MNGYPQGTAINIVETFVRINALTLVSTPADPDNVTMTLRDPNGEVETFTFGSGGEITNPDVGVYVCFVGPDLLVGTYTYEWKGTGNGVDAESNGTFEIHAGGVDSPETADPDFGPCQPWITGSDVASCGPDDLGVGSELWRLDDAAYDASAILYEISGRQYPGLCERTVRPCGDGCGCWNRVGVGSWYDSWLGHRGCAPVSKVKLSGTVREIVAVKIGGETLPYLDDDGNPNWRVDRRRDLVRLHSPVSGSRSWPGCQNLSLNDDQPNTFSVAYTWGVDPPTSGKMAAAQLGRELWLACSPTAPGECRLPTNVTQVVRQGITIERRQSVAMLLRSGSTGLPVLDAFLAATNPTKMRRRPAVWSPDVGYAR